MEWKNRKLKLTYKKGEETRFLNGEIIEESEFFYDFRCRDGRTFSIAKNAVIEIVDLNSGGWH